MIVDVGLHFIQCPLHGSARHFAGVPLVDPRPHTRRLSERMVFLDFMITISDSGLFVFFHRVRFLKSVGKVPGDSMRDAAFMDVADHSNKRSS